MTMRNTTLPSSTTLVYEAQSTAWQRLAQYFTCAGLGMVGGATGTAIAIGLAIVAQVVLFPTSIFLPGLIPLNVVAVFLGLMVSWLLGGVGYRVIPSLASSNSVEEGIQVILIFSGLVSLLETTLYMYSLYV